MTESKAREFFIQQLSGTIISATRNRGYPDDFHVIEKSYADKLQSEIEALKAREIAHLALIQDLQFQLADRSEKYRIAMDKGVDILADKLKQRDELLRECEIQLEILINSFMDLRVADGPKKFSILRSIDDKISDALMVLQKLRDGKK